MKSLQERIWDVRTWLAPLVRDVPGSSSYIMQLDSIAHDVATIPDIHTRDCHICHHGTSRSICSACQPDYCVSCLRNERDEARSSALMYKKASDAHFADIMKAFDQCDAAEAERDRLARELAIAKAAAAEHAAIRKSLKEACDQNGIKHDELRQRADAAEHRADEAYQARNAIRATLAQRDRRIADAVELADEVYQLAPSATTLAVKAKALRDTLRAAPASPATATKESPMCVSAGCYRRRLDHRVTVGCPDFVYPKDRDDNLDSHSKEKP